MFILSAFGGCSVDSNIDIDGEAVPVKETNYTYNIPSRYYSDGIKNIVKRARQIKDINWMPVSDLDGFNSDYFFKKNVEITGIPYSQPVTNGKFLIYQMTLEEYIQESKIENGPFYTERGEYEEPSTYYGMDCSSFVSYAWNCRNRLTAKNLSEFGDLKGTSINKIQVGDALIKTGTGAHAVLVTGVKEDSKKNVVWVEITEQTPPVTKRTFYGKNELFTIDEFISLYLDNGFKIYRNTDYRDNIPFVHSCVSPIDEYCDNCCYKASNKSVKLVDFFAENYIFEVQFSNPSVIDDVEFSYSISHVHLGWEKYITDSEHYLRLRDVPNGEKEILTIKPKSFVTIFEKCYDSNGELWGKTKYNNKVGWLYLESSKYLGGDVVPGEEKNISKETLEEIPNDKGLKTYKCLLPIHISSFPKDKKIQVFVTDSAGKKYLVGEYHS